VVQDWAQPLQAPELQDSPAGHWTHAWPRAPHAVASVPVTQVSPVQQPLGHVSAVHDTDASDEPPALPPATPPAVAFPPAVPPAAPPSPAVPPADVPAHEARQTPSLHNDVPVGHPVSSGLKADSFDGSTHTHDGATLNSASQRSRSKRTGSR
jgi:hypothetical protein